MRRCRPARAQRLPTSECRADAGATSWRAARRLKARWISRCRALVSVPVGCSMSRAPVIGVSKLLKSCATPPVSWPSVSSFWASCSWAIAVSRSRGALLDRCSASAASWFSFLKPSGARLILPAPAAQRRLGQADESRRMERPLEKGHVAQHLEKAPALRDCAPARRRAGSAERTGKSDHSGCASSQSDKA